MKIVLRFQEKKEKVRPKVMCGERLEWTSGKPISRISKRQRIRKKYIEIKGKYPREQG